MTAATPQRVALVTGANRGLGLEVSRQLAQQGLLVYLAVRDLQKGEQAAKVIGEAARPLALDLASQSNPVEAVREIERSHGRLDVLINNAAVHYDTGARALHPDWAMIREAFETNVFGAWRVAAACAPLLAASGRGRLVNVSSGAGALESMGGGTPAYSVTKAALNALTRILADELRPAGVLVNAVCPGWVATDMGGRGGRPVEEGAAGIVWAATLPEGGPTGGFFRDRQPIPW
jgi:NAD(P)-dependent dehydrogenase (short-subunit alcohol dehydrogenase family)